MMNFDVAHSVTELVTDRRSTERRLPGRRNTAVETDSVVTERRPATGERRVRAERRRQIDPTTCERDYSDDEVEFMSAMDDYKRRSGRQFPTWSEVLEVVRSMGYRKVADATEIEM